MSISSKLYSFEGDLKGLFTMRLVLIASATLAENGINIKYNSIGSAC
jgi:hypothetical protein